MLVRWLVVVCLGSVVWGQEFGFDTWTTANGLPQNTVTGVVQTPDGYLWVSTFDGLARFDGVKFTIFDKGNTKGILNNRFTGIFLDKEGTVWSSTENGVVTIYRNGEFTSFQVPEEIEIPIAITADAAGNALIQNRDKVYHLKGGNFIEVSENKLAFAREFYYGRSGTKWTLTPEGILQEKSGAITSYPLKLEAEGLSAYSRAAIHEDQEGTLWFGVGKKLYYFENGSSRIFTETEIPPLGQLAFQSFSEDADGTKWLVFGSSVYKSGSTVKLVRYKDEKFTTFDLGEYVSVNVGITDREGNNWFATQSGLRRLRKKLITTLSAKDGLNSDEVYPLFQTETGDVLIGSANGVNRYADGKVTDLRLKDQFSGLVPILRGFWQDKNQNVWLGFFGFEGFGRFEGNYKLKRFGKDTLETGATDFTSDADGNVWIATEKGLMKYKDDQKIAQYTVANGLRSDQIITLHFDRSGNLWLGTFDGLSLFKDGKFTNFAGVENSPQGFVRAIYEDADGVLWFGTYGDGLVRYKDGEFFDYRVEHGLFNNGVFAILEDGRGNFWMSGNRGIHRVSKQELNDFADGKIPKLNSVSYDENDGMLNAECNGGRIPAAIKTKDGKLWFATMGGVAIVDPEAEKLNPNPPPVLVERIEIDRKIIDSRLLQSAIEMLPGQSNLEISYTGLSLIKSNQIKFKYKLEGFEENWVEAGNQRTANYSYLPHGNYVFRVIAANADGVWNNEGAAIKIIVHPFFYQTWWFRLLAVLAIVLVVWLIYQNRVSHLRQIAETKTQFTRKLIESQETERKRIAAELHDGLGQNLVVIKNRAMLGIKKGEDKERTAKEFHNISESATQALEEVREITNNLRPQLLDRLGLTKAINAMLKKVADVIEVESEIDSIDDLYSENEEISIYRIVQESLNNVLKHSNATLVKVKIKRTENSVSLRIEDNGRGFALTNVTDGLGLVGLKERSQLLNGELIIDSTIGEGTSVLVKIQTFK
jgi:signal transduction histidine kinase/ligand-binding sensor domain-containing protein